MYVVQSMILALNHQQHLWWGQYFGTHLTSVIIVATSVSTLEITAGMTPSTSEDCDSAGINHLNINSHKQTRNYTSTGQQWWTLLWSNTGYYTKALLQNTDALPRAGQICLQYWNINKVMNDTNQTKTTCTIIPLMVFSNLLMFST